MDKFPSWRYGPNGQSGVFESAADVPTGWVDHPSLVGKAKVAPTAKDPAAPKAKAGRKPKATPAKLDL